jgi:Cu/Ag efflux pump CusA
VRILKRVAGVAIRVSVRHPWPILGAVAAAVLLSAFVVTQLGRDFLPPFNEGSVQVNAFLPPGASLEASNRVGAMIDERIKNIEGVVAFGRRTGRAELGRARRRRQRFGNHHQLSTRKANARARKCSMSFAKN